MVNVLSRLSLSRMRAGDHADVRLRLRHRHARLQAGHHVVVLVAAPVHGIGAERERHEDIHMPDAGHGGHDLVVQQKLRAQHAGDGELILVRRPPPRPDR